MRDLTKRQALDEAVRRWGKNAGIRVDPKCKLMDAAYLAAHPSDTKFISRNLGSCTSLLNGHAKDCPGGKTSVTVGHSALGGLFFMVKAQAYTFREAFEKADRDVATDKAKFAAASCRRRRYHRPDRKCAACAYKGPKDKELHGRLVVDAEGPHLFTAVEVPPAASSI